MKHILFYFLMLFITPLSLFSQEKAEPKPNSLIIYGNDFSFHIKEVDGWVGDTENASQFYSNIILYDNSESLKSANAIVQVRVFEKQDENTIEDLNYDIESYKKSYSELKIEDFKAPHTEYKVFSKLVFVENEFFQYLCYLNPGKQYKLGLSIAMNVQGRRATKKELSDYLEMIQSLAMLQ